MKYCTKCNQFVEDIVHLKEEKYKILNEHEVEVTAKVHLCSRCGAELFDEKDDSDTLEKVYMKYESMYGPINPSSIIKKVK